MMSPTRVASHATDRKPKSVFVKVECCNRCLSSGFVASGCGLPAQPMHSEIEWSRARLPHTYPALSAVQSASTAIALISIRYSGEVILQTSTMVEAGAGGRKYSRRTLWICSKCSMLRT